jgi:hypothetical protein
MKFELHQGDCLDVLKTLADCSVHAIVTDPPAGIAFMNREWDRDKGGKADWIQWMQSVADQCLRVIKPGGHALVWAIPRTSHWTGTAWEDAGWQPRDKIYHIFGSGFPKSLDVSKAIDKGSGENRDRQLKFTAWMRSTGITADQINEATQSSMASHYLTDKSQPAIATADLFDKLRPFLPGVPEEIERLVCERTGIEWKAYKQREVVGETKRGAQSLSTGRYGAWGDGITPTAPATEAAKQWEGWGAALKPAAEEWWLFRKPLIGTVAANVLEHGTGGLNIGACRIGTEEIKTQGGDKFPGVYGTFAACPESTHEGRFPANFTHDGSEQVLTLLGEAARFFMAFQDKEVSLLPENQYNEHLAKGGQSWQTKNDPLFLAGTAAKSLSLPKALEFIARSVVVTSDRQEVTASSDSKEHSICVTQEELKTLCECVTTAMMILGNGFSLESKLEKHTPTKSLVKVVAAKEPTGTTTIMTSLLKSDGSAENATLRITQKSTALGGQAYRIAYIPKASRDDRDEGCGALEEKRCGSMQATEESSMLTSAGNERTTQRRNTHSTVKPTDLMRYLCRLITPPNGIVLDPFTGSGSTGKAAMAEGFRFIGIEREAEYIEIARARISAEAEKPRQLSLF